MPSTGRFWIGKYCADGENIGPNVLQKVLTFATATTGAIASKELFTVTGEVLATIIPVCEGTDLTGATATIEFGVSTDTDLFVGTTTATDWDDGEFVLSTTPSSSIVATDALPKWAYISDDDIGYEVKTAAIDTGVVRVYCLWWPISDDALVEVAGVNVTL